MKAGVYHPQWRLPRRPRTVIGIDPGSAAVKAIGLEVTAGRARISGFALVPRPDRVTDHASGGADADPPEGLIRRLRQAAPGAREAAISLPDEEAITRVINVPAGLGEAALRNRIRLDIEASLKQSHRALAWDFRRFTATAAGDQQPVQVVAARPEAVARRTAPLRAAGLRCRLLDLDSHAMVRAALMDPRLPAGREDAPVALLDLGTRLRLTVFDRERIQYRQDHTLDAQAGHTDRLRIIEQALAMHHGSSDARTPGTLALAGGGADERLAAAIDRQLTLPSHCIDPLRGVDIADRVNTERLGMSAPRLVSAIGLALHAGDPHAHWR